MIETLSLHRCFGGMQGFYRHESRIIGLPMRYSVFVPERIEGAGAPALFFLAGLTCTEETFMMKAGAQRFAARHGLVLIAPDTSPRNTGIEGEAANWDFGAGAGFYLDATEAPWSRHFRMESYIADELFGLVASEFNIDPMRVGISGHSMGGHGALVLALRHPGRFRSVSAFAPIAAPTLAPWGKNAFPQYLGANEAKWAQYDASALMRQRQTPFPEGILIDQGLADKFLSDQLHPEAFEDACRAARQPLELRRHSGYDHGYYFIASFIEDHLAFHARILGAGEEPSR